ncbi:BRCA1-associated RING domain protein 1 isoform X2 [Malania oleifera]|uniref:BRCA1-associated RING domain protein 1 isoform X2 n=1 Tax=Malania oleifera TaxID=397392 RepID=UPI0025AD9FCD|nr:BRCA1-associated RING domain protein 1 isoform X2 [Malania oleifera]
MISGTKCCELFLSPKSQPHPMADSPSYARFLNPWVLHLQKLALELKCPVCLNLFTRPMLLPCNHIFCNTCLPRSNEFGSECPLCKVHSTDRDLRQVPSMENMVTIYKSLDATLSAHLFQTISSEQCRVSESMDYDSKSSKEHVDTSQRGPGDSGSGQSILSLTANKRVQNQSYNYDLNEVVLNAKFDKCTMQSNVEGTNFVLPTRGAVCNYAKGTSEIDMSHVAQSSQDSPPSFGADSKGLDDDSSDQGSVPTSKNYPAKRSMYESADNEAGKKVIDRPISGAEEGLRDLKRQKKLEYGQPEISIKNERDFQPIDLHSSRVQLEPNGEGPPSGMQQHASSDSLDSNKYICAFCQSFQLSEATGPMLHYASGKPVVGDEATGTSVIHVHRKCIEWAPQVYFVSESVKNLKKELARSAKLKCSSCGLKGAALGCYAKSCRKSYHVPCAVQIVDCRWDCENFLVLCPNHSSFKFPNEKSNYSKHICNKYPAPTERASQKSDFRQASPNGAREWVLCGSALSSEDKFLLVKFATMSGATVAKSWSSNVSHVIAATDAQGACTRTLKVLMAILNGKWILTIDWIKACIEAMHPVDEEPYEVSLDNHGCREGPKTGRFRILDNAPKLFNGLNFYFTGEFLPAYERDLQNLVATAGGTILKSKEKLMAQGHEVETTPTTLVVYNLDPPQGCDLGDEVSVVLHRLEEADTLAAEIGSRVIPHTWLLESIAACKLLPFAS